MKVIIPIAVLIVIGFVTQAQTANFSGNWKRNDYKTKAEEDLSINSVPTELQIKRNANSITILKINKDGANLITTYTTTLNLDGSAIEVITPSKLRRNSSMTRSDDKKALLETAISKADQGNVKQTYHYTYTLEDGRKTLKIAAELEANEQTYELTEVFEKQ